MNNKFSVIIPLYNKEKFIKKTVMSVLDQDYDDFEIIIIDDCSEDYSLDVLKNMLIHYDKNNRVKIYRNEKNMGVGYTRNKGIELATGNYILFLDADDEISNLNLFKNINFFIENYNAQYILLSRNYHNKFVRPNFKNIRRYLEFKINDFYEVTDNKSLAIKGNFPFGGSGSAIISTNLISNHRFDIAEPLYEDWLFFMEIFLNNKAFFYDIESIKVNYDKNSLTKSYKSHSIPQLPKVYYLLNMDVENKKVRRMFFWLWLNSNIKANLKFEDSIKIIKKHKKEIINNISFGPTILNLVVRIVMKNILSLTKKFYP